MRGIVLLSLCSLVLFAGGCSRDLTISPGPFRGPSIGVDSTGDWHEVIARLPSPGWEVTIDSRRPALESALVFVTLRRPNPVAVYPDREVIQRVLTTVRTEEPIEIFARELAFGADGDKAYSRVTTP